MPFLHARFKVVAQASPTPTYQWYIGDQVDPEDRELIPGKTNPILNLSQLEDPMYNGAKYSCKITNAHGTAWTRLAMLTIESAPVISDQPDSQQMDFGNDLILAVVASGVPAELTYQWYKASTPVTDGGRVSGATTATMTITNYEIGDAGVYHVVVTNTKGSTTSEDATITSAGGCPCAQTDTNFYDFCSPTVDPFWTVSLYGGDPAVVSRSGRYECDNTLSGEFGADVAGNIRHIELNSLTEVSFSATMALSYAALAGSVGAGYVDLASFWDAPDFVNVICGLQYRVTEPGGLRFQVRLVLNVDGNEEYGLDLLDETVASIDFPFAYAYGTNIKLKQNGGDLELYLNDVLVHTVSSVTLQNNAVFKLWFTDSNGLKATDSYIKGTVDNINIKGTGLPDACNCTISEGFWTCTENFTFVDQTAIQNDAQPFMNYKTTQVAGFKAFCSYTCFEPGGGWDGYTPYHGMGIAPYNVSLDCLQSQDTNTYLGCWVISLRFSGIYLQSWIGSGNNPRVTSGSSDIDGTSPVRFNAWIEVREDLGSGFYNVYFRLQGGDHDLEWIEENIYLGPELIITISGSISAPSVNNGMVVDQVQIQTVA